MANTEQSSLKQLLDTNHRQMITIQQLTEQLKEANQHNMNMMKNWKYQQPSVPNNTSNPKPMGSSFMGNTPRPGQSDPNGYCWSHGFKVSHGHSSATCTRRVAGHQTSATRMNTMGGSEAYTNWKNGGPMDPKVKATL